MRRVGLLTVLVLLAIGCGGGDGSLAEDSTATSLASTTTQPATTTTADPWTSLPDPGMPPVTLSPRLGGTRLESICLDITDEGTHLAGPLRTLFEDFLGVPVVAEECQAILRVEVTAARRSASYGAVGVCYQGWRVTGEATLVLDGAANTWRLHDTYSPPVAISERDCVKSPSASVDLAWWWHEDDSGFPRLLREMFGDVGLLAAHVAWGNEGAFALGRLAGDFHWQISDMASALVSWLYRYPRTAEFMERLTSLRPEEAAGLLPAVPYLIALLRPGNVDAWPGPAQKTLENITGLWFGSQEEWWSWWEGQSSPTTTASSIPG